MNEERIYQILLGPVVSEKAARLGESGQVVFRVRRDAHKREIRRAVEKLFNVVVEEVRTVNVKGKRKRYRQGIGRTSDWKKAYVRLAPGQEIDFTVAE
ncbi:MAG: 50S ribosomal protein L23 [Porticoccaceae bacterium]|nr:MAG: 50S ribosomal protein L23 [Porticoccaceae bacterium]